MSRGMEGTQTVVFLLDEIAAGRFERLPNDRGEMRLVVNQKNASLEVHDRSRYGNYSIRYARASPASTSTLGIPGQVRLFNPPSYA